MSLTPEMAGREERTFAVPWSAWRQDVMREFVLPAGWRAERLVMPGAPPLSAADIEAALDAPIDADPLQQLARGRSSAAIAIDDMTRPTPTREILPGLVDRLRRAGVNRDRICVVIASGAHRMATARDIEQKVGDLAMTLRVVAHDPNGLLVDTGVNLAGVPIRLNEPFARAELRIGIGAVMPHPFAGFSGGGKVVVPGLSDLDVTVRTHKFALMGFHSGDNPDANRFRRAMEAAVREIGLHWSAGVVVNERREIAGLFTGDMVASHRAAVAHARRIGETTSPPTLLDCLVLNAYPKDGELLQIEAAFVSLKSGILEWLRPGAPIVLTAACANGVGVHQLFGPSGRLFRPPTARRWLRDHPLWLFVPGVTEREARTGFWEGYPFFAAWADVSAALRKINASGTAGILPCGPLQIATSKTVSPRADDLNGFERVADHAGLEEDVQR